ncbi:hypothetical protein MBLNU457_g1022t1 [Dothideomycetes sp. NU457]
MDRLSLLPLELRELITRHLVVYYQTGVHLVKPDVRKHPDSRQDLYNLRLVSRIWAEPPLVFINETLRLRAFTTEHSEASTHQSSSVFYAYHLAMSRHASQVLHLHIDLPFKFDIEVRDPEPKAYLEALTWLAPVLWKFTNLETLVATHDLHDHMPTGCFDVPISDSESQDLLNPEGYFNQLFNISRGLHYSVRELSRLKHIQLAIPMAWSVDLFFRPPTRQLNLAFRRLEHLNIRLCIVDRDTPLHFLAQCNNLKTLSLTNEHYDRDDDLKVDLDNVPWSALTRLEGLCLRSIWIKAETLLDLLDANRYTLRKLEMIHVYLTSDRWSSVFSTIDRSRYPLLRSLRVVPKYDVQPTAADQDGLTWSNALHSIYMEELRDSPPWRGPGHILPFYFDEYEKWFRGEVGYDSVGADLDPKGKHFGMPVPPEPDRPIGAWLEEGGLRLPDTIGPWRPVLRRTALHNSSTA